MVLTCLDGFGEVNSRTHVTRHNTKLGPILMEVFLLHTSPLSTDYLAAFCKCGELRYLSNFNHLVQMTYLEVPSFSFSFNPDRK